MVDIKLLLPHEELDLTKQKEETLSETFISGRINEIKGRK